MRIDASGARIPIVLFGEDGLRPSDRALRQLARLAREPHVQSPVVALPDIHDKKENDLPTGVVVAAHERIYPPIMVSGVNCGMRLIQTPLRGRSLREGDVDRLFTRLAETIRTRAYFGEFLSVADEVEALRGGARWAVKKFGLPEADLAFIESRGNAFGPTPPSAKEIREVIPSTILEIGRSRMGFLGKGNHFLELQRVSGILDAAAARAWGVEEDALVFLLHCGSGGVGSLVGHFYTPRPAYTRAVKMRGFVALERVRSSFRGRRRRYVKRLLRHLASGKRALFHLDAESEEGRTYLAAIRAVANFGFANRTALDAQVRKTISDTLGARPGEMRVLYDMSHVSIMEEEHYGERLWIHRSGASRAFPSAKLSGDSPFKATGEPIFLPGSMGDATYLCAPLDGSLKTFCSSSHGAGRKPQDQISEKPRTREELAAKLRKRNVVLYKGFSKGIVNQDPDCFKSVETVVRVMREAQLAKPVARLEPVAVLKG